jgi:hypothetical protein
MPIARVVPSWAIRQEGKLLAMKAYSNLDDAIGDSFLSPCAPVDRIPVASLRISEQPTTSI